MWYQYVYGLSYNTLHSLSSQGLGFMYATGIGVNSNQAKVRVHVYKIPPRSNTG